MKSFNMHLLGSYTVPDPVPGVEQNSGKNWPKSLPSGGLCSNEQILHNFTTYTELKFIVWALTVFFFSLCIYVCISSQKLNHDVNILYL